MIFSAQPPPSPIFLLVFKKKKMLVGILKALNSTKLLFQIMRFGVWKEVWEGIYLPKPSVSSHCGLVRTLFWRGINIVEVIVLGGAGG